MTWASLLDRVLVPFESRKGQLDTRAGKYLDEAMEDFSLYSKCYVRKFNMYISADKNYIELPSDFVEMKDAPVFRGTYLSKRSSNAYLFNQDTSTNRFNTGTPAEYYLENRRLHLIPRPSQAGVLTLTYVAVPVSLRTVTSMKQFRFDGLVSEFFRRGQVIKSISTVQATATATVTGGVITAITITNAGAGYITAGVVVMGGGGANGAATATVKDGLVSAITITNGGSGYGSPTIAIGAPVPSSTSTVATIERADHDEAKAGLLTVSGVTNGFANDNEYFISTGDESSYWQTLYATDWQNTLTTWNNLGFGGIAKVLGSHYTYTETSPIIPDVYHYALVDYAKAMIHQDLGNDSEFQNHYTLYLGNREKSRTTSANAGEGGMSYVSDRVSSVGI